MNLPGMEWEAQGELSLLFSLNPGVLLGFLGNLGPNTPGMEWGTQGLGIWERWDEEQGELSLILSPNPKSRGFSGFFGGNSGKNIPGLEGKMQGLGWEHPSFVLG